jgi:hypothetical protein
MNIVDTFKKSCNIFLKADSGIEVPDVPDPVVFLAEVEIIQFDLVGFMVDFEGEVLFIPWGSVKYIDALAWGTTNEFNAMPRNCNNCSNPEPCKILLDQSDLPMSEIYHTHCLGCDYFKGKKIQTPSTFTWKENER